ncbi:PAS domain S-box protein, partial [bacterium]|nr:PAS domain S-box protein [bacterium]
MNSNCEQLTARVNELEGILAQREQSLHEIEAKYRALFDNTLTAICIYDAQSLKFQEVNRAYTDLYGYSREELLSGGMTIHDITVEHDSSDRATEQVLKQGTVFVPLRWHRKKDGSVFPVELVAGSFMSGSRRLVFGLAKDITARCRAEESLQDRQGLLQAILDNVNSMIVVKDVEGRYLLVNRKTESVIGLKSEEIVGKTPLDIYPSPIGERVHADDMQVIKGAVPIMIEETLSTDENRTYFTTKVPLFDEKGQVRGMCGLATDITERIQLEQEHIKAAKLESIGLLAGGIAHDFNNILTSILGNISLADIMSDDDIDKTKELLKESEKACLRAKNLTRQLLTFSRGGEPQKRAFCVKEPLEAATRFALHGSNVRAEFDFPEEPCVVDADPGQLDQVINNLVINAVQAMPEGGLLSLKAGRKEISGKKNLPLPAGRYVFITLRDRGVGIPKQYLAHIFDPYFTTKQKGSGLGLTTCFAVVKRHGGHITVESEPGKGTEFTIYLPVSKERPETLSEKADHIRLGGGRVLVMDDEPGVLQVASLMLKHLGCCTELAADGAQALEAFKAAREAGQPFDAVILDLTVPGGMGGRETLARLLEIDPGLKAIVSSGYSNDDVIAN